MDFSKISRVLVAALLCVSFWASSADAARLFNGTSDDLQSAATIDLSTYNILSVSYWLWVNTITNADHTALETSSAFLSNSGSFYVTPDSSGLSFKYYVAFYRAVFGQSGAYFAQPSAAAWHHYVHTIDRSVNPGIETEYLDGAVQSFTYYNQPTQTNEFFGNYTLNVMATNNASNFLAGRIAELAIWGGKIVGQTDVTALNAGTKFPNDTTLDAGAATFYWRICGATSPELAVLGGVNLTVNGSTDTPHPSAVARSCQGRLIGQLR